MRICSLFGGLAAVLLAGVCWPHDPLPSVVLFAHFETSPDKKALWHMQQELDSILAPAGFKTAWVIAPEIPATCRDCHLTNIRFLGRCDIKRPARELVSANWLGRTITSEGELFPFVEVNCNRIEWLLGIAIEDRQPAWSEQVLGRAFARVLAHELYHVLANTKGHGASLLTRKQLSREALLAQHLSFDMEDIARIRR
ncbi:MAG: hypothetical protein C5B51_15165 [Terriglobia bacterium]|nr:MAG: hypothetical protein C5B51_15165 [Terriglobia bacterium]